MNANLVRASGFELHVEEREAIEALPHAIERKRAAAAANDRHARAIRPVAREWLIDTSGVSGTRPWTSATYDLNTVRSRN